MLDDPRVSGGANGNHVQYWRCCIGDYCEQGDGLWSTWSVWHICERFNVEHAK